MKNIRIDISLLKRLGAGLKRNAAAIAGEPRRFFKTVAVTVRSPEARRLALSRVKDGARRLLSRLNPVSKRPPRPAKVRTTPGLRNRVAKILSRVVASVRDSSAGRVVTLDINGNSIKVLEAKGRTVKKWASSTFDVGADLAGDLAAQQRVMAAAVRRLMVASGIKPGSVVFSVNGLSAINRIIPIQTPVTEHPTQEAIRDLVVEAMPLPQEQLHLTWKVITPAGGERLIFVVGIPREAFEGQIRALKKEGINANTIESKPVTLSRLAARESALIVNIEPSSFDTIVVVDSIPTVSHTSAWQPQTLTVEDQVELLANAVEIAVEFNNSHHPETAAASRSTLLVTGEMSTDSALVARLGARLGCTVAPLTPALEYPAHFPVSAYAVNIGLALRTMAKGSSLTERLNAMNINLTSRKPVVEVDDTYESLAVNLLPQSLRPWRPSAKQAYPVVVLIVAASLVYPFFLLSGDSMDKTSTLQSHYNNLNSELERRKLDIKNREPFQAAINNYDIITRMDGFFAEDLQVVMDTAKDHEVTLDLVSHDGKQVRVSCTAATYVVFREYTAALAASEQFAKVTPPEESYPYNSSGDIILDSKLGK